MELKFDIIPYVQERNSDFSRIDYENLSEDLKKIDFLVVEKKNRYSNAPVFSLGKYQLWKCSEGWIVAENNQGKLNRIHFNNRLKMLDRYEIADCSGAEDLEIAINWVIEANDEAKITN